MDEELMRKLGLLSALTSDEEEEMFITSVKEANVLLQMNMTPKGAKYRRRLVEYITDPAHKVMIEPDVFHNFIMDLCRCGDFYAAVDVCEYILGYAPKNMDILADMMKACGDSCQFDLGESYLKKAQEIPEKFWSWRMYLYSVDFLKTKLQAYPDDQELFERAKVLAEQYIKNFPADEHGYNQLAEIYLCVNDRQMAIDKLDEFIFRTQPEGKIRKGSCLICAQCCVTLLNIMDGSNDYDEIIKICDRGLECTTQEQPSASIGFFIYRKALAMDASLKSVSYKEGAVKEVLTNYQIAYDLNQDRDYRLTIEKRYALLRAHLEDDKFVPLKKRKLFIDEDADAKEDKEE